MARSYDIWLDDLNGVEYMKVEFNLDIPEGAQPYEGNIQCTVRMHDLENHLVKIKFFNNEIDPLSHLVKRIIGARDAGRMLYSFIYRQTGVHDIDRAMFPKFDKAVALMFDYHARADETSERGR